MGNTPTGLDLDEIIYTLADELQSACEAVAAGDIRNTVFTMRRTDAHLKAKQALTRWGLEQRIDEHKYVAWTPNELTFIEKQAERIAELQANLQDGGEDGDSK